MSIYTVASDPAVEDPPESIMAANGTASAPSPLAGPVISEDVPPILGMQL